MSQSAYTCITCHVAFLSADIQRHHYKSDWHRYNLKRKVVSLPPVTVEEFQRRAAAQEVAEANTKSEKNISAIECKLCQRKFSSFSTHTSHLMTKRHRNAENKELEKLKKGFLQNPQVNIEKNTSNEVRAELTWQAMEKALAEARMSLKQPIVIRTDTASQRNRDPEDNPRYRWYKRQVRVIEGSEAKSESVAGMDDEEWEELSDSEEVIGDQDFSEYDSQTESTCTEESVALSGILSKVKFDSDADIESLLSEGTPAQCLLGPTNCLFCDEHFQDMESNVTHMTRSHSFFIPELTYLIDLEGLLKYLGEKVGVGNVCLWCNEKGHAFFSLKAVRSHMIMKGHCKMLTEGDAALEYADFYDFRPSYPDDGGSSDEELDDDQMSIVTLGKPVYQPDCVDAMELVLPSGAKIGHRSLMRYYKQNFPTVDRFKHQRSNAVDRLLAKYKAIGWRGAGDVAMLKHHHRDMRFVQKMKSKYSQQLGAKHNRTMMKHFRPQVIF